MRWYLAVLKKYAVFRGRARRREYWFFVLFSIIITAVLAIIDIAGGVFDAEESIGLLSGLHYVAVTLPGLAVSVRRLHDIDRTGWWLLIGLVPLIGAIVLLVFAAREGQPGENRYGIDPKAAETSIVPAPHTVPAS